jgi:hypothetical protein
VDCPVSSERPSVCDFCFYPGTEWYRPGLVIELVCPPDWKIRGNNASAAFAAGSSSIENRAKEAPPERMSRDR